MQIVFTHCPHIYQNNFREYHTIGIHCYSVKMPPKQIFWCIDSNCKKKRVNSSDFAVSCDNCGLWQHIRFSSSYYKHCRSIYFELNEIMRFWTFWHFPLLSNGLVTDK